MRGIFAISFIIAVSILVCAPAAAASLPDSDHDGLIDQWEVTLGTDPENSDTDGDGFPDGLEIKKSYDPLNPAPVKRDKRIEVDLSTQRLKVFFGETLLQEIKISSGLPRMPTPAGEFAVLEKRPVVQYRGAGYNFPNTKWNLLFKKQTKGNLYIHGAYWHNNFGRPMSHGCVNVSYADMEPLYGFADAGAKVKIYGRTMNTQVTKR